MKGLRLLLPALILCCVASCAGPKMERLINRELKAASLQYKQLDKELPDSLLPRSWDAASSQLITSGPEWWCSGFFPGSLWMLYQETGDEVLREAAVRRNELLRQQQFNRGTHDLGFMLYNSFGKGYAVSASEDYRDILLNGAESLASRYNPVTGTIKSWDHSRWEYPVIIDNMMNLEYLFWAARQTGDRRYSDMALSHAGKTIQNHFRADYSTYHVVDYDTLTGNVKSRQTAQGFSDSSAWARGQAWGLYGFTMMYRETGDTVCLEQAKSIAGYLLRHPRLPDDLVPYWDYDAPGIPGEPRDASSAAIMASALIELSGFVQREQRGTYLQPAIRMLNTLSSPAYRNRGSQNGPFLLLHSVGSKPQNSEVDVPLSYADYYYLEALIRLKKVLREEKTSGKN